MALPRWVKVVLYISRVREVWTAAGLTTSWFRMTLAYLSIWPLQYPWELVTRRGQVIRLENFHDLVTAWVVFCRGEYRVPRDAGTIVDLGANFGAFTLLAAGKAGSSKIVSVEPFPRMFDRLEEHVGRNGLKGRVECMKIAVGRVSGERFMPLEGCPDQSRSLLPENSPEGNAVAVKTLSFEDLMREVFSRLQADRVDLLKIDIEGAEHEWVPVLKPGALARIRAIQLEYHPNGSKQVLFDAFQKEGFYCVKDWSVASDFGVAHFIKG
jgi:FkbM family methyltransferase